MTDPCPDCIRELGEEQADALCEHEQQYRTDRRLAARSIAYEQLEAAANALDSASGWAICAKDDALHMLASEIADEFRKVIREHRLAS